MKIAIIVAMGKELNLLLPLLADKTEADTPLSRKTVYTGRIGSADVAAMQCGIGKVNSALVTSELIDMFHPDLVINTGVAGGTGETRVLDLVVGDEVAYHDVWCGPGTEWGEAAGCPRFFESAKEVCGLDCLAESNGVKHGLIASGDIFVSTPEEVTRIRGLYPEVKAVDMESASIAQTCYLRGVPFFVMRVVSDTPGGEDNIAQYNNFWDDAPRQTFGMLQNLLTELTTL
ncbi:MAG: 5'-methylthioadenosine/adenosylhomocysteine nucleosidase [Barnesiella sp.]|nr:5'-methylthioadenosine/adenosylhomocysteine nucleosidase [Barnesiella sp.]